MDNRDNNKNNDINSSLAFLGIKTQLENHFSALYSRSYDTMQIRALIDKYERNAHPATKQILTLLRATARFRAETHPDNQATREQDKKNLITNILTILNTLAKTLKETKQIRDEEGTKNPGSITDQTLSSAIDYCTNSVLQRLKTLDQSDKILSVYGDTKNQLNEIIPQKALLGNQLSK